MIREAIGSYDIAELAREANVSSRTIRYYGELGLLKADGRGPGRRRRFAADALERLRFIDRLKKLGMTLEEIGDLNRTFDAGSTPAMLDRLDVTLAGHQETIDRRIHEMERLREDLVAYRKRIRSKREGEGR